MNQNNAGKKPVPVLDQISDMEELINNLQKRLVVVENGLIRAGMLTVCDPNYTPPGSGGQTDCDDCEGEKTCWRHTPPDAPEWD